MLDVDIVVPMHNLTEYGDNYFKTSASEVYGNTIRVSHL